jgi:CMP-N-acetylneuraminic acid synthetase
MNIIALIPARGQSKRIPKKNLRLLGGKPLVQWTIEAAQRLMVDLVVVSTEDTEIAALAKRSGAQVLDRPPELASDNSTDNDVVAHFQQHYNADFIIYLRPTTPFRGVTIMRRALIEAHQAESDGFSSLRSVQVMAESAFKAFFRGHAGKLTPILFNGQDLTNRPNHLCPTTYQANGYVDILFPKSLDYRSDDCFGQRIYGFITPHTIELDTPEQWDEAARLVEDGR